MEENTKKTLITIGTDELSEVGDFNQGERVRFMVSGVVRKVDVPTPEINGEEKPEYDESSLDKRYVTVEVESYSMHAEDMKDERREANEAGMDVKDYKKIHSKRMRAV